MKLKNFITFLEAEETLNNESDFSPTDILNLALWLDGSDSSSITYSTGISVSQWSDKSGNNRHATQGVGASQPTYSGGAVIFDGVNDSLFTSNFVNTSGSFTYFIVYSHPTTSASRVVFSNGADVNGFAFRLINSNQRVNNNNGVAAMLDSNATPNQYEIVSVVRDTTPSATMYVNGSSVSLTLSTSSFANPTFGLTIGSRQADQFAAASIKEIIMYNRNLSFSEISQVHTYLNQKHLVY